MGQVLLNDAMEVVMGRMDRLDWMIGWIIPSPPMVTLGAPEAAPADVGAPGVGFWVCQKLRDRWIQPV
jgi:hypothetical protein